MAKSPITRAILGAATLGQSETIPAFVSATGSLLTGKPEAAGKSLLSAATFGGAQFEGVTPFGGTPKISVPGVDPELLELKKKQEAIKAAEKAQGLKRRSVLSEFLAGPALNVSGGGKSVLGSNLFG